MEWLLPLTHPHIVTLSSTHSLLNRSTKTAHPAPRLPIKYGEQELDMQRSCKSFSFFGSQVLLCEYIT